MSSIIIKSPIESPCAGSATEPPPGTVTGVSVESQHIVSLVT